MEYTGASSLELAFRKVNSTMNRYSRVLPPCLATRSPAAFADPPVAIKSSTTTTLWPGLMASTCISNESMPYSFSYEALSHGPGSFPCFRTATKAAPNLKAIIGPRRNPRASKPTTTSIFFDGRFRTVWDVMWWRRFVIRVSKATGSRRMGKISRKFIPCQNSGSTFQQQDIRIRRRTLSRQNLRFRECVSR